MSQAILDNQKNDDASLWKFRIICLSLLALFAIVFYSYNEIQLERKSQYLEVTSASEKVFSILNAPVGHTYQNIEVNVLLTQALHDSAPDYTLNYQAKNIPILSFDGEQNDMNNLFGYIISHSHLSINVNADNKTVTVMDSENQTNQFNIKATNSFYYRPNPYGYTNANDD